MQTHTLQLLSTGRSKTREFLGERISEVSTRFGVSKNVARSFDSDCDGVGACFGLEFRAAADLTPTADRPFPVAKKVTETCDRDRRH